MSKTFYSDLKIKTAAEGLMDYPPKLVEYDKAVKATVAEVVNAIKIRIEKEVSSKQERV